jgi:hypothetical protein
MPRHVSKKGKGIDKEPLRVQRALKKQITVAHKSDQSADVLSSSETLNGRSDSAFVSCAQNLNELLVKA